MSEELTNQKINWFPGHMSKTLKEIKGLLSNVDVVCYVLDSRAPISSINPSLNKLVNDKPILYIFNKIDMADEKRVKELAKDYKGNKKDFILLNSTMSGGSKIIKQKINNLAKDKIEKFMKKGIRTLIRVIVIGVPNSGKSTLVNNLCGKAKAITGNRPGVTKQTQWLNIGDNIELCDTPGTLYPNLENQEIAEKLLFIGSIKDEVIIDNYLLAQKFLKLLQDKYPQNLKERYGENATLDGIARKRGLILSKDELDYERTANAIFDDFRKGRLGKVTLD